MVNIEVGNFQIGNRVLSAPMQFRIPNGQIHALVGPNGCGKSLLLDALTGIYSSNQVSLQINNSPIMGNYAYDRWQAGVRRMFQAPTLPGTLKVKNVLDRFSSISKRNTAWSDQIQKLLKDAGIRPQEEFGNHSFGQKRIIELVVASSSGKFCILDEPFSGMSSKVVANIMALFKLFQENRHANQPSILVVDHQTSIHAEIYSEIHAWLTPEKSTKDVTNYVDILNEHNNVKPLDTEWSIKEIKIDNRTIAKNLNIYLPSGSTILLMGGNGTGKSTLLRALGRLSHPWKGVNQRLTGGTSAEDLIFSPQPPKLVREITAEENLKLMISRGSKVNRTVLELAYELTRWLGVPPSRLRQTAEVLSGGESSLISLAGAIVSSSPVMLLDEPFESLSEKATQRASALLDDALGKGKSAILSLHKANDFIRRSSRNASLVLDSSKPLTGVVEGAS